MYLNAKNNLVSHQFVHSASLYRGDERAGIVVEMLHLHRATPPGGEGGRGQQGTGGGGGGGGGAYVTDKIEMRVSEHLTPLYSCNYFGAL